MACSLRIRQVHQVTMALFHLHHLGFGHIMLRLRYMKTPHLFKEKLFSEIDELF